MKHKGYLGGFTHVSKLPKGKEILERKETIEFMKKFDINRFYPTPENLKLLDKIYNQKEEK